MEGVPEKEVAARLHISQHTVHDHIKKIYGILDVHSRGELLHYFENLPRSGD